MQHEIEYEYIVRKYTRVGTGLYMIAEPVADVGHRMHPPVPDPELFWKRDNVTVHMPRGLLDTLQFVPRRPMDPWQALADLLSWTKAELVKFVVPEAVKRGGGNKHDIVLTKLIEAGLDDVKAGEIALSIIGALS